MSTCTCQQFELYAAEEPLSHLHGRALSSEELQSYVDGMREHPWWDRNFADVVRIEAYTRPPSWEGGSVGSWHSEHAAGKIEMSKYHMVELYVCHEVAHCLAEARFGSKSHDPWFARTYLELVYTVMGSAAYASLKSAFEHGGVDHDTAQSFVPGGVAL
jgi:putative metallohydrolase (TIGR04338 family)